MLNTNTPLLHEQLPFNSTKPAAVPVDSRAERQERARQRFREQQKERIERQQATQEQEY